MTQLAFLYNSYLSLLTIILLNQDGLQSLLRFHRNLYENVHLLNIFQKLRAIPLDRLIFFEIKQISSSCAARCFIQSLLKNRSALHNLLHLSQQFLLEVKYTLQNNIQILQLEHSLRRNNRLCISLLANKSKQ